MSGLEVEEATPAAPPFDARRRRAHRRRRRRIRTPIGCACAPSTSADREMLQIVCGAPNAAPGMLAPCALEGATLPGGLAIKRATMRGVESRGMLCSAKELGIDDDASGLLALDASLAPGTPAARRARARRHADHAQDHAQPRRLPVDRRHRARRRGRHRRAARRCRTSPPRRSTFDGVRPVRVEDPEALPALRRRGSSTASIRRRPRRRG